MRNVTRNPNVQVLAPSRLADFVCVGRLRLVHIFSIGCHHSFGELLERLDASFTHSALFPQGSESTSASAHKDSMLSENVIKMASGMIEEVGAKRGRQ